MRAEDFAQVLVEVVNQEPPKVSAILAQAPKELDQLFAQALAKDAEQRPEDVGAWAVELADSLERLRIDRKAWRIVADAEPDSDPSDADRTALFH